MSAVSDASKKRTEERKKCCTTYHAFLLQSRLPLHHDRSALFDARAGQRRLQLLPVGRTEAVHSQLCLGDCPHARKSINQQINVWTEKFERTLRVVLSEDGQYKEDIGLSDVVFKV